MTDAGGSVSSFRSRPTGTSSAAQETASPWKYYITIDGQQYRLPEDGTSTEIVLDDGSLLVLGTDTVSINDQEVNFHDRNSESSEFSADGRKFVVDEGFDDADGSGGSGGSGGSDPTGSIKTLSELGDTENSISTGLDKLASGIKSWTSGGADSEISSLSDTIDSAISDMNRLLSPMRNLAEASGTELDNLTPEGARVIFDAYPKLERGKDILSSMNKLLRGLSKLQKTTLNNVKTHWLKYVSGSGALLAARESVKSLHAHQWDEALKHNSTPLFSRSTRTTFSPSTSTSDRNETEPTGSSIPYWIETKRGTPYSTFKNMIQSLDGGTGTQSAYKDAYGQSYITKLTPFQAKLLRKKEFIKFVDYYPSVLDQPPEDPIVEDYVVSHRGLEAGQDGLFVTSSQSKLHTRSRQCTRKKDSPSHLKMISANQFGRPTKEYTYDSTGGAGTTIYIIDSGFRTDQTDVKWSPLSSRQVSTWVVPNELTLHGIANEKRKPADHTDWTGHGTSVASVAGGTEFGVASDADLYLVKVKNAYTDDDGVVQHAQTQQPATLEAMRHILDHIERNNKQGKAVINYSLGLSILDEGSKEGNKGSEERKQSREKRHERHKEMFLNFERDLKDLDAVLVISAGNDPNTRLEHRIPQMLGREDNAFITVGGVDEDGQIYRKSTPQGENGGSLTVWAQAVNVRCYTNNLVPRAKSGTSLAAPAVVK
ncbi:hypothetical protein N7492_007425 [Penicillium capsulatum]|uniref:Peptidase S8/S53 domain-containing protein n=1 Tax=Penicillium capsulatum TaxID=69766 RepID=A0A9W9LLT3_9EURO|nr:hypothetical protein N7492_007425 [Penicillium capsulatum]